MMKRIAVAASLVLALSACQDEGYSRSSTRHLSPIPPATMALMEEKGMSRSDPILIRSYKKEAEMEVWKKNSTGRYALLKTYPICRWSGQLGPKVKEGDRQAPEGFYTVTPSQMNPNSAYYLSFDTGFPNAYDRSFGRTGAALMVHGSCSSRGCFAMTDQNIAEIYAIARDSLSNGQRGFQFQSYPFRMTAKNLAQHRLDQNIAFWKNLKEGSDYFEVTKDEPRISVAAGRYQFNVTDETVVAALHQKARQDDQAVAELVSSGVQPVKVVYNDGGSHESFVTAMAGTGGSDGSLVVDTRMRDKFGDISRPEGLSSGPQEIVLDDTGKPKREAPSTALAFASAPKVAAEAQPAAAPAPAFKLASATPQAPAPVSANANAAAAPESDSPFYKKMLGGIGDLFSTSAAPAQTAPAEPAQVATTPLPPQRTVTAVKPAVAPAVPPRRAQAQTGVTVAVAQ
ncbi:L,D-transpeptidase family protein [Microvirga antarctica]|uniref:L,D-transpeptidase family protein n=1 Tax=Microvirga antarctica TaxID=2819233 RepID=UPI001B300228|nr:murein L,D-transpeptidase family protein [Microvirga antarctica]